MTKKNKSGIEIALEAANPRSGSSLVPMLVGGLVLIVTGMAAVLVLT